MVFLRLSLCVLARYFRDVTHVSMSYSGHFSAAVFFLLSSEVLKVISFIIPLKLILLLSGQQIPQSLSPYMAFGTLKEWVLLLSFMTVLAYLMSIGFFYCAKVATRKGSQAVRTVRLHDEETWSARKMREVVLFYKLFSESLADFILVAICFSVVA